MKKIAIITGASGGCGKAFVRLMLEEDLDEIWAVARNKDKLDALKSEFGDKIAVISKDLSNRNELHSMAELLKDENPRIVYLVNSAGTGKMGSYADFTIEELEETIDVSCNAVMVLCSLCIPYMERGGRILNLSSEASFQPIPYLNIYAASKAFVRSYSRALNVELRNRGITVTAVCPGWVDTDMLLTEINNRRIKFPGLTTPDRVAVKALHDAGKGKDMSVCTAYVKFMHVFAKIFPQRIVMNAWIRSIRRYGLERVRY